MKCPNCSSENLHTTTSPNGGNLLVYENFGFCSETYDDAPVNMIQCMECETVFYINQKLGA